MTEEKLKIFNLPPSAYNEETNCLELTRNHAKQISESYISYIERKIENSEALKNRILELEAELAIKTNALEQIRAKSNGFEFNSECEEALSSSSPSRVLEVLREARDLIEDYLYLLNCPPAETALDLDTDSIELCDQALSKLKEVLGE